MPKLVARDLSTDQFKEMAERTGDVEASNDVETSRLSSMAITANNPVHVSFRNITYSITVGSGEKKNTKIILQNLSGDLVPGTMTAIMGPTGSGKTSLLNVLANRMPVTKGASLTGGFYVNGGEVSKPVWARRFGRLSAYVMQEDAMNAFLTVRETLGLAASFQLPPNVSVDEKLDLVNAVIGELGLNKVGDTLIGDARTRGVSGGEKKRANIGVELIKNPSALFLDEPTSGLDSFQAQSVMTCMSNLAQSGRTICASIHQPRSSIFALFDELYLISEGKAMYSGKADQAVGYFASVDEAFACPPLFNPADWFLDVTSADYRTSEAEKASLSRIDCLQEAWGSKSALTSGSGDRLLTGAPESAQQPHVTGGLTVDEEEPLPTYQSNWGRQVELIAWRSGISVARNKGAILGKVLPGLFFALVMGWIYSDVGNDQKAIQDRIGALFFFTINQTFGNLFSVLQTFSAEKVVVERERASKSYRLTSFYIGKVSAELPMNLVSPLVFGCIVYWLVGLNPLPGRFFSFLVILLETGFAAIGFGMVVASASPSAEVAQAVAPIFIVLMILFGGFYINVESLPDALSWIQYLSIMRWSFMGLLVNEFEGTRFSCSDVEEGDTCVRTGDETIRRLSFGGESVSDAMAGLLALIIGFNLLAYAILRFKKKTYLGITPA